MSHAILLSLVRELPMVGVAVAAIVVALVLWQRAPLSSVLVVVACSLSVILLLVYPFAYEMAARLAPGGAESAAKLNFMFGLAWSLFRASFLAVMVLAVYAGRNRPVSGLLCSPTN